MRGNPGQVLDDVQRGQDLYTFGEIRKRHAYFRPDGKPADLSYVYRIASKGKLRDGRRIVLESIESVRGRVTTLSAVDRFAAELNRTSTPERELARAHSQAEHKLAALGI